MKKVICFSLLIMCLITLCSCTKVDIPEYLEYDGYTLVTVQTSGFVDGRSYYGFIKNETYESFQENGELDSIILKHPFKEGTELTCTGKTVEYIKTGVNKSIESLYADD